MFISDKTFKAQKTCSLEKSMIFFFVYMYFLFPVQHPLSTQSEVNFSR